MAAVSNPTSGYSSQAIALLSGQAKACMKKHMNEFRDELDDPALKTDAAFRKILKDSFFEFIALESQALTAEEKGECQRIYPLNKRLFNHEGTPSFFLVEELGLNKRLRPDISPAPVRSSGSASSVANVAPAPAPLLPPAVPLAAFGKAKWEQYFGDIGEEPPLPPNIHEILQSPCPFWPDKTVQETQMLVLIPATVNGAPFTLNIFGELIQHPKQGDHATQYSTYWEPGKTALGDQPPPKSYWILMTKKVLLGSRSKPYAAQCQLVKNDSENRKIPYQAPSTLESATSILLEHVQRGTRLYNDKPYTYTHCQERVAGYQMVVGGFVPGGLSITSESGSSHSSIGITGVRRL